MPARINPCLDLCEIPNDLPTAKCNSAWEFTLFFKIIDRAFAQRDHCQQLLLADEHFARFLRFFLHNEFLVCRLSRFDYCPIFPEHSSDIYRFIPFKISTLLSDKRIFPDKRDNAMSLFFQEFFPSETSKKMCPTNG